MITFLSNNSSRAFFTICCILFVTGCTQQYENTVVAKVGGKEILLSDLRARLVEYQFDPALNTAEKNFTLKKNILNELIQEEIVVQLAQKNNIEPDPQEIQSIYNQMYQQVQGNPTELETQQIKEKIRHQMLASELYTWVTKDVETPSEETLQTYYQNHPDEFEQEQQIRLQQIIVKNKDEAQSILEEVQKDVAFEQLVQKYSILPQSSLAGDTGFVSRGILPTKLEDIVYKLSPGSIGPIIETKQGFHIVKVLDKKKAQKLPFKEVRDFIFQNLFQQRKEKYYNQWLEQSILQTNIERNHAILQQNIFSS